jgi:hypothetical protein
MHENVFVAKRRPNIRSPHNASLATHQQPSIMACTDLSNDRDDYPFTFAIVYADPLQFADPRGSSESSFSPRKTNYPHRHGSDSRDILRRSTVWKDDSFALDDNNNHSTRSAPLALASRSIRRRRTAEIHNDSLRSSQGLNLSSHSTVKARDGTCLVSDRNHHSTRSARSTRSASTSRAPRRHGRGTIEINTDHHDSPKRKHVSRHPPSVRANNDDLFSNDNNHSTRSAPAMLTSRSIWRGRTIKTNIESPLQSRSIRASRQLPSPTRRQSVVPFSPTLQATLTEKCKLYSIVF